MNRYRNLFAFLLVSTISFAQQKSCSTNCDTGQATVIAWNGGLDLKLSDGSTQRVNHCLFTPFKNLQAGQTIEIKYHIQQRPEHPKTDARPLGGCDWIDSCTIIKPTAGSCRP
jgi:hypothetical protein